VEIIAPTAAVARGTRKTSASKGRPRLEQGALDFDMLHIADIGHTDIGHSDEVDRG
jgi:hypothetical protein